MEDSLIQDQTALPSVSARPETVLMVLGPIAELKTLIVL